MGFCFYGVAILRQCVIIKSSRDIKHAGVSDMKKTPKGRAIKLTLTVKRPSGDVETIVHPTLTNISPVQFAQIQRDTKAAGRGEVLSYEVERENVDINTENARKAKQHDNIYNEGAGGFNPYR